VHHAPTIDRPWQHRPVQITEGFGLVPLPGGHSGETFLAEAAGERTVVRIYAGRGARRGPEAPDVDAAVLRLVRGLLPVPEVLEVRRADPSSGSPGLLVTTYLPGERLDVLLPRLDTASRATVGREVGLLLARLAQMPMPRAGLFVDGDLRVSPFPAGDLAGFVAAQREGTALQAWPPQEYDALVAVADRAQTILEPVRRTCLVHSDLNPKNMLVDPETCRVTALLDWEFAHAGLPVTDLGNLLRFDRDEAFAGAVLETYRAGVVDATDQLLDQARAADLLALVDLAARRHENPVAERAHALLRAIAVSGDLHATAD
jgi:aminoglycoside phosphotransferase (APT) family kinase protein